MRSIITRTLGTLAIASLVTACSAGTAAVPSAAVATMSPSPTLDTTLVADLDVGGRTMHIVCIGPTDTGRPTVIFEHGLGGDLRQWNDVLTPIGATDRGCTYDRAGSGGSEPATVGRTTKDQVADLRALLAAASVEPPYILVGYSVGGWNVMVHADAYPDDVIGAVLVDVRPPAASQRWLEALPPRSATESEVIKGAREEATIFDTDPTLNPEGLRLADSASQAIETSDFGDMPLTVLTGSDATPLSEGFEPALGMTIEQIWWDLQDELASRSTQGRLIKVEATGHEVPFERPDAVVDAIQAVLAG